MARSGRWWLMLAFLAVLLACGGPATPTAPVGQIGSPTPAVTPSPTVATAPTASATVAAPTTPVPSPSATATPAPTSAIEVPAAGARVTLPLHVLAHVGQPGERVTAVLRWQDGSTRSYVMTALREPDGRGLVIGTPPWWPDQPPQPRTQGATLELRDATGSVLAAQTVTVLDPSDPGTRQVRLYWTASGTDTLAFETRTVVRTDQVATSALQELLWGPPPASNIGYATALPTPAQVLSYPGRQPDWGPRVTLLGLTITDGVATANFSSEMAAYGGGSLRVKLIRDQVSETLEQFPTVHEVRIAIDGQTEGVLEP